MIKPTIGRVVLVVVPKEGQPHAGLVAYVHSDRMINVAAFDGLGNAYSLTSLQLLQDGDEPPVGQRYAEWMPYQKGQAAKTEEVEALLIAKAARAAGPETTY